MRSSPASAAGYLLPIGLAVLTLMTTNLARHRSVGANISLGPCPVLYAQGKSPLAPVSYWIVVLTGLVGMLATYLWWKYADQNR